ncbi:glycosyltransferase family 2 protein [Lysinibacillus piscis]|uniref:Glycosyl transferase n=1 Tax=Lysinibacillus piscis TaxID=2518931 RepID=A0ABQ5NHN7_9BACI|nr:glycosyltransferase family 2 protein [Lysinibacillus sp. KH24]GLC87883.1 putative glycosyl transferase [Lysinibacillus sp. KH24]
MKILIIIPAFNEEENLGDLIKKIKKYDNENNLDILVINDQSTDETSLVCKREGVNVIDLPCNLGIGGAVQTGYKFAAMHNYDIAIQVDGDGQHNPEYIEKLIEPIIQGHSTMVIGSRYIEHLGFQSSSVRRMGIWYLKYLINTLTGLKITDPTSGYRACNKEIIQLFSSNYPKDYPEPESIMYIKRKGLTVLEIPVIMNERIGGESSINLHRSIYYMIKVSLAILFDKIRKESF